MLEDGRLVRVGVAVSILQTYLQRLTDISEESFDQATIYNHLDSQVDAIQIHPLYSDDEKRWGDGKVRILHAEIMQQGEINSGFLLIGHRTDVLLEVIFQEAVRQPVFGLTLKNEFGSIILTTNSREFDGKMRDFSEGERARVAFGLTPWVESGRYFLSLGVVSETPQGLVPHDRRYNALALCFVCLS